MSSVKKHPVVELAEALKADAEFIAFHGSSCSEILKVVFALALKDRYGGWRQKLIANELGSEIIDSRYDDLCGVKLAYHVGDSFFALSGRGWRVVMDLIDVNERGSDDVTDLTYIDTWEIGLPRPFEIYRVIAYDPIFRNPNRFRHDMTLLRMFETEWYG